MLMANESRSLPPLWRSSHGRGRRRGPGRRDTGRCGSRAIARMQIRSRAAGTAALIDRAEALASTGAGARCRTLGACRLRRRAVGLAGVGPLPAEHLEEDDAQAEDVAPLVDLPAEAQGLLGAHVGRGADHGAVVGQAGVEVGPPGQAEVDQPGAADGRRSGRWPA